MPARPGAGAPRLPDAVKKARGTFRRDRAAPVPAGSRPARAALPKCPGDANETEQLWWETLAEAVEVVGVYTKADAAAFRLLVKTYALLEDAHRGRFQVSARGDECREVNMADILGLTGKVSGLLIRFGLDPASRDKLVPAPSTEASSSEADPDDFEPIQ